MKKYPDKKILLALLFVGASASFIGARLEGYGPVVAGKLDINTASVLGIPVEQNTEGLTPLTPHTPPEVTVGFVGDIMMDRGVKHSVMKNFSGDYSMLFADADFLKTPDIMFGNLEGPASNVGTDLHNLYSFRMDPAVLPLLKEKGFDVLSLANNHMGDWTVKAFVDTLNRVKDTGIIPCGAGMNKKEAVQPAVLEKDGYKVGFICFTDVGPTGLAATETKAGLLLASDPEYDTIIKNASSHVDVLIVSFHWGVEYKKVHNTRQEELAKRAIDAGATAVAGHHPHVSQDIGEHKGSPIFYSFGNFIFDQSFSEETMKGLFVATTLKGKEIIDTKVHQVVLDKNFAPSLEN